MHIRIQSGSEVFNAMRKLNPNVKIILVSGYAKESDVKHLLTQGALGFLQKPFNLQEFSRHITEAVASSPQRHPA